MKWAVRLKDVKKEYPMGGGVVQALRGVTLGIPEGDYVAIMGPSGSGKSTLLNMLGCLDRPSSGQYFLGDEEVSQLDDSRLSLIRAERIGFVFQGFNLVPELSLLENILLPLFYRGWISAAHHRRCQQLAEMVGLGSRIHHLPSQLSGGQQQRGAIARSLANDPTILLADEPTGNLDSGTTLEILDLLASLNAAGKTVIIVTHEPEVAQRARRIVRIKDGLVVADEQVVSSSPT
jgi:putative ABC transport system ATP-binding protein